MISDQEGLPSPQPSPSPSPPLAARGVGVGRRRRRSISCWVLSLGFAVALSVVILDQWLLLYHFEFHNHLATDHPDSNNAVLLVVGHQNRTTNAGYFSETSRVAAAAEDDQILHHPNHNHPNNHAATSSVSSSRLPLHRNISRMVAKTQNAIRRRRRNNHNNLNLNHNINNKRNKPQPQSAQRPRHNQPLKQQQPPPPPNQTSPRPRRIPNVLLAGAQKAGTTAVAEYLQRAEFANHICWAQPQHGLAYTAKEPHFFDHNHTFEQGGLDYYQRIYSHCQNHHRILLDATPNYFTFLQRIYDFYRHLGLVDDLKVIFIVREPMARELSWFHHLEYHAICNYTHEPTPDYVARDIYRHYDHYLHHDNGTTTVVQTEETKEGGDSPFLSTSPPPPPPLWTFAEYLNQTVLPRLALETESESNVGLYVLWLRQWFALLDRRRQIWVVHYDQVLHNQTLFLDQLHAFLNLPLGSSFDDNNNNDNAPTSPNRRNRRRPQSPQSQPQRRPPRYWLPRSNQQHAPDEDTPSCAVQEALYRYFEPYNEQLYHLLDQSPGGGPASVETRPFARFQFQCHESKKKKKKTKTKTN
ncbi:hypothetical protein ACA910_010068 [Epithemia clementina (nom. ined.)]